jgi:hypothetical protein
MASTTSPASLLTDIKVFLKISIFFFFLHSYVGSLIYIKHMLWNEVISSRQAGWFSSGLCYSGGIFLVLGRKG